MKSLTFVILLYLLTAVHADDSKARFSALHSQLESNGAQSKITRTQVLKNFSLKQKGYSRIEIQFDFPYDLYEERPTITLKGKLTKGNQHVLLKGENAEASCTLHESDYHCVVKYINFPNSFDRSYSSDSSAQFQNVKNLIKQNKIKQFLKKPLGFIKIRDYQ